jgi:hypothetical protein
MPQVLPWWQIAQQCFSDDYGSLRRGFLTSLFMLVCDIERVFHLEDMNDLGFGLLTGSPQGRAPTRQMVGAWRKHLRWNEVDRFCHRTSPWELLDGQEVWLSFDEHSIPRWTKKFSIPKGYVTTRNKYMRSEKLYYGYDVVQERFVTVKATPGKVQLRDVSDLFLRRVLRYGHPAALYALFDAGAGKSDADVRRLLTLADETPNLEVILRACRYPHRMKLWKALPPEEFTAYEEPGDCRYSRPKEVRLAETETVLKGESEADAVRTIVCRQVIPGPKKDRWHPLYTSLGADQALPREVLDDFRQRQHHEQAYRVEVHDAHLDAARCAYDKDSPDRKRPRFCRGPLQLTGWLPALLFNACGDLCAALGSAWKGSFLRTLRRKLFDQPGTIYCTPTSVIVYFDEEFRHQDEVLPLIDRIHAEQHRIPWLDDRLLVLSTTPDHQPRAGP